MNLGVLKAAEAEFLGRYPRGFDDPAMVEIGRKHKVPQMVEKARELFVPGHFEQPDVITSGLVKIVSQSSMVSVFEKPRFRDFMGLLSADEKDLLVAGWYERLHGNERAGFEMVLDLMATGKIAKWTLMSICPVYFNPRHEVFVKPTTAKRIISALELDHLHYQPRPDWAFYSGFREAINTIKQEVDPGLSPNNAAFTGFLMMTL